MWLSAENTEPAAVVDSLTRLCKQQTDAHSVSHAVDIVKQIPVYEGEHIRRLAADADDDNGHLKPEVLAMQAEWTHVLLNGAGVIVVRNAIDDIAMLDRVTVALQHMLDDESQLQARADHFAASGANSRLWNSHEKLCLHSPDLFARYNANDTLALMCRAWLGPAYQITAQVNVVHPGGRAQVCHRDYHLGFQDESLLTQYPAHVHGLSPLLTLQAGIAHSDVPLASGATQLLPFSQQLLSGYVCAAQPEVRQLFAENRVQVAMEKGDMLFFNPAVLHAAGDNDTDNHHRFVNLLQVGSAYGRTMELLDRTRMAVHLYPVLQTMIDSGKLDFRSAAQVVAACAEGYAFPACMDLEPPVNGLAPESPQALMLRALQQAMPAEQFSRQLEHQQSLKRSH